MKKKRFVAIAIILVLIILLFPIRMNLKDGGSVRYKSLVYEVTKIHQLAPDVDGVKPYIDGFEIRIFGITLYRETNESETITFHDKTVNKSDLSQETLDLNVEETGIESSEEVTVGGDIIPMVMVSGELYLDTGHESTVEARCGVMDGEITSSVDRSEYPTKDNESNFGTGYGYQYGPQEGTIEIYMNNKWWVFATEKVLASSELIIQCQVILEIQIL